MLRARWPQGVLIGILVLFCSSQVWAEEPIALENITVTANKVESRFQALGTSVFLSDAAFLY